MATEVKEWQKYADEYSKYLRVNKNAVHITASDRPDRKYMVWVYDVKKYLWINADIYADTEQECIDIAEIIFDEAYMNEHDEELKIKIDYGDYEDDADDFEKLQKIQNELKEISLKYDDNSIKDNLFDIEWSIKKLLGKMNN